MISSDIRCRFNKYLAFYVHLFWGGQHESKRHIMESCFNVWILHFWRNDGIIELDSINPKGLDKKSFISFCSSYWLLMILNFRWRSLILGTTIFILNILWVCFICIFDLSSTSFKSKTVSYLYSVSSYWLNLLWSLSVWIVSIESFIGFTVHAKYTLATNIQRFLCHFLYFCWSLGKSNLYTQDRWWHYLCRDYSSYHSRIRKVVLIPFG